MSAFTGDLRVKYLPIGLYLIHLDHSRQLIYIPVPTHQTRPFDSAAAMIKNYSNALLTEFTLDMQSNQEFARLKCNFCNT